MKFPKDYIIENYRKIVLYIFLGIVMFYVGVFAYSLVFEQDKIAIDRYNFGQLEKVKSVLENLDKNSYKFDNVSEFNKKFNQDIKPIKNCYFLSERNGYFENSKGDGGYIFGFQFESVLYKLKYLNNYYAYPKYNLPVFQLCFGLGIGGGQCYDGNKSKFKYTISNPCWD